MSELNLKIDPEFENLLPPLTEEEFNNLEELILQDGEVRDPIITWNGTIVDGHNRWKIICKHPDITWTSKEKKFTDKWEVIAWMILTQNGRRNVNPEYQSVLRAKYYEAQKLTHGGNRGNRYTSLASFPKENLLENRSMEKVAKEFGVGEATIYKDVQFSNGLDAIREEDPELADDILKGKKKVKKVDVMYMSKVEPEERKELVNSIRSGERITTREKFDKKKIRNKNDVKDPDDSRFNPSIDDIKADYALMTSGGVYVMKIETLIDQINSNIETSFNSLFALIGAYKELSMDNYRIVMTAVKQSTATGIEKIKELILNEHET